MKQIFHLYAVVGFLGIVLSGCATHPELNTSELRQQIETENDRFETFIAEGDAAGIASLYTSDAQLLPPDIEPVVGRSNIQEYMAAGLATTTRADLNTVEVEGRGNMAYELGTYAFYGTGEEPFLHGKYTVIWKRENGQWKLHRDIWNVTP